MAMMSDLPVLSILTIRYAAVAMTFRDNPTPWAIYQPHGHIPDGRHRAALRSTRNHPRTAVHRSLVPTDPRNALLNHPEAHSTLH
jgi:hypothetical protein